MNEAARLREARIRQGRTARSVAIALALSPQYVGDLEHGRRTAPGDTYARLCAELGIENDRPEAEVVRLRAEVAHLRTMHGRLVDHILSDPQLADSLVNYIEREVIG